MKKILILLFCFIQSIHTIPWFGSKKTEKFHQSRDVIVNSVVQVNVYGAEIDAAEPYKISSQGRGSGSGFLFDERGCILTNYHVVRYAKVVTVCIPCFGQKEYDVRVKGIYPDLDVALLELSSDDVCSIKDELGFMPYIVFGDSDKVALGDDITLYGYPAGYPGLKSIKGDIRGFWYDNLVTSVGANPGNSGGPVLNQAGEVVGIYYKGNSDNVDNMTYAIPINYVRCVLDDMFLHPILYDPFFGYHTVSGNEAVTSYYKNPFSEGCFFVQLAETSILFEAGIRNGDMLYMLDQYYVDSSGTIFVPWLQNRIGATEYVRSISQGKTVRFVVYRLGREISFDIIVDRTKKSEGVRRFYQGYEKIDYEIFGGLVVMELSLDLVDYFRDHALGIAKYATSEKYRGKKVLIITKVFSNAPIYRSDVCLYAAIIESINGERVATLQEYRQVIKDNIAQDNIAFQVKTTHQQGGFRAIIAIPVSTIMENEPLFAKENLYTMTSFTQSIVSILQQKSDETKKTA